MKIIWVGPYKYPDSYSLTARNFLVNLYKRGVKVKLMHIDSHTWENVPYMMNEEVLDIIRSMETEKFADAKDVALFQFCIPPSFIYEPNVVKNIGYTMFETDRVPRKWIVPLMSQDEIWNPSEWGTNTFERTGLKNQKLRVLPIGYDEAVFYPKKEKLDIPELKDKKVFGCCFDWTPRKNGIQTVGAFLKTFAGREDVALLLKCYFKFPVNMSRSYFKAQIEQIREKVGVKGKPDIILYSDIIPDHEMGKFYNSLDFHISVSHGEGYNKSIMEAMACGVPSIATMWSGQMDFCNTDNTLFVSDCPLGPVDQQQIQMCGEFYNNSLWAMPSFVNIMENLAYADKISADKKDTLRRSCLSTASHYTSQKTTDILIKNLEEALCE